MANKLKSPLTQGVPHLKQAGVGVKAAGIQDAVLPLVELGQFPLQVLMEVLRTHRVDPNP